MGQQTGWWVSVATNGRMLRAKNPGLLETYRLARIAQKLLMIKIDTGHHSAIGSPDIDRIKTPAETDFQHHGIKPGTLK
jgi:hypothetical protein